MASKQITLVHVDEDYIDMELNCSSNFFTYTICSSPPKSREFEFQMNCISNEKDSIPSPADDLFYKGKLLPLHLPPRLQMVQKLLVENPNLEDDNDNNSLRIPISESCRVSSSEANPNDYSFLWSSTSKMSEIIPNKSWPKKLKQMKQFLLGQKLKASRTYLKSLFNKSGCSNKSSATTAKRNNPFEIFNDVCDKNKKQQNVSCVEDDFINHRKSFSGVVQRHCGGVKSSSLSTSSSGSSSNSSSFSFSSSGCYDLQLFKRSISANYGLEGSVEGAIAHCKMSQQQHCSSKNILDDDARICSQYASRIEVCGNEELLSSTKV